MPRADETRAWQAITCPTCEKVKVLGGACTVGFGVLRAPMLCFTKALKAFVEHYGL
jgi:hypothetical protein